VERSPSLEANSDSAIQEIPSFMVTEGTLPCSFTRARHWSLPWNNWIQSKSSHFLML